jgi:hypothetical protein
MRSVTICGLRDALRYGFPIALCASAERLFAIALYAYYARKV